MCTHEEEETRPHRCTPHLLPPLVRRVVGPPPQLGLVLAHLPAEVQQDEREKRKADELQDEPGEEDFRARVVDLRVSIGRESSAGGLDAERCDVGSDKDAGRADRRAVGRQVVGWSVLSDDPERLRGCTHMSRCLSMPR